MFEIDGLIAVFSIWTVLLRSQSEKNCRLSRCENFQGANRYEEGKKITSKDGIAALDSVVRLRLLDQAEPSFDRLPVRGLERSDLHFACRLTKRNWDDTIQLRGFPQLQESQRTAQHNESDEKEDEASRAM